MAQTGTRHTVDKIPRHAMSFCATVSAWQKSRKLKLYSARRCAVIWLRRLAMNRCCEKQVELFDIQNRGGYE